MKRFEVYLVQLDPTRGSEVAKTRPCTIVSPNSMNHALRTVIVAPLTTTRKEWPSRVGCVFGGRRGEIALDQMRAVYKSRLVRRLGTLQKRTAQAVCATLVEIFAQGGE